MSAFNDQWATLPEPLRPLATMFDTLEIRWSPVSWSEKVRGLISSGGDLDGILMAEAQTMIVVQPASPQLIAMLQRAADALPKIHLIWLEEISPNLDGHLQGTHILSFQRDIRQWYTDLCQSERQLGRPDPDLATLLAEMDLVLPSGALRPTWFLDPGATFACCQCCGLVSWAIVSCPRCSAGPGVPIRVHLDHGVPLLASDLAFLRAVQAAVNLPNSAEQRQWRERLAWALLSGEILVTSSGELVYQHVATA